MDHLVAERYAAMAGVRASLLNRHGRYESARDLLIEVAQKIKSYSQNDSYLIDLAAELEALPEQMQIMGEMQLKRTHASSLYRTSSSDPEGSRRRRR